MPQIIDMHCHHFAMTSEYGGYVHPRFAKSWRMRAYAATLGLISWKDAWYGNIPDPHCLDELYQEKLVGELNASAINHAVILAFDGVYNAFGKFDHARTPQYVSNDAVLKLCNRSQKMLFCASINPYRADWEDELQKCYEGGAVLIKWLPSVMGFDPANPLLRPFYRRLRELDIPLLIHIGFEYALPTIENAFCGLDRLEEVLKTGVRVIAAHCCGGRVGIDSNSQFDAMVLLLWKYPNLSLDVSGMASVHRKSRLLRSIRHAEVRARLIFGTDFPVPIQAFAFRSEVEATSHTLGTLTENYFDRYLRIMQAVGLPEDACSAGYQLIGHRISA